MLRTGLLFTAVAAAPAAAAPPTWENHGLEDDSASNQRPRVKLWVQVDTGEDLGDEGGLMMPFRFGTAATSGEVRAMADREGSLVFIGYERQQPLLEALLTPPLILSISDTNGRSVVTTPVPTEGAESALRNLPCMSRFFYEFDQARARRSVPNIAVPEGARPTTQSTPRAQCGDGTVQAGEACDDGNESDNDSCSADCSRRRFVPICGDGVVQRGEACDDHNRESGDTCEPDCTMPVRGGGVGR